MIKTVISKGISKTYSNIQEASGESTEPHTPRTDSCKAWNFSIEYPNRESKNDMKESEGDMFTYPTRMSRSRNIQGGV